MNTTAANRARIEIDGIIGPPGWKPSSSRMEEYTPDSILPGDDDTEIAVDLEEIYAVELM